MAQAQLKLNSRRQVKRQGKNYVERTLNSASNDNPAPLEVWLKRLLPFSLIVGGLLLLLF